MAKFKSPNPVNHQPSPAPQANADNDVITSVDETAVNITETSTVDTAPAEAQAQVQEVNQPVASEVTQTIQDQKPAQNVTTSSPQLQENSSALEKVVAQTLESYAEKMKPGLVLSADELNQQQLQMWRIIRLSIESAEDFNSCYNMIIDFARAHKDDVFHDRYLYRGMDNISLDKTTATYFMGSLNVIKLAATSKNKREAAAQVDLNRVMNEQVFSEEGRNRVIAYFAQ